MTHDDLDRSQARRVFAAALAQARQGLGLSQARLAERLGMGQSAAWSWEQGEVEPSPEIVFALERELELDGGSLSRHLGYLPLSAGDPRPSALAGIAADPDLDENGRRLLIALYREIVRPKRRKRRPS